MLLPLLPEDARAALALVDEGVITVKTAQGSRLHLAIHADTCETLCWNKNGYVNVGKADMVAGWTSVIDSRDRADASYPKSPIGLDERDLFAHPKGFSLRIHHAPFIDTARYQWYTISGAVCSFPPSPLLQLACRQPVEAVS